MHSKFLVLVLLAASGAHAGNLTIDESTIDLGEVYQFTDVSRDVQVWNRSGAPIRLVEHISTGKADPQASFDVPELAPGKSAVLHIRASLNDRSGKKVISVPFETIENGKTERYRVALEMYVDSLLDEARPAVDLGVVEPETAVEKPVKLQSQLVPDLHVKSVLDVPDFVSARIGEDRQTVFIKPAKVNVLGIRSGIIKLALDSNIQKQAWITVTADMRGAVVPDQNPLSLDLQRPHARRPVRLQMTGRGGAAVHIGKVTVDEPIHADVAPTACLPEPRVDCSAYLVSIKPDQPHGPILGKITFELPDTGQWLEVKLNGMFLGDDAKVISLNDVANRSASKQTSERRTDLAQALKNVVNDSPESTPPGTGPLLKWDVANEAGMFGYAIFRSNQVDGHYTRVNHPIVQARNGGDGISARYQWRDNSAVSGNTYWYYISILYNDGHKQQLTGPQKVTAK